MIEISSFSNPRYKFFKSLAKSRNRKKEALFVMEGREELDMAHSKSIRPQSVLFSESYIKAEELTKRYGYEIDLICLTKPLFDELTYQNVPGNYIGIFKTWHRSLDELKPDQVTVVLESPEKPGNLGAILRTCEAAGITNVLVTDTEIDLFNPNVIRNSRGAFLSVNAVFCSNGEALDWLGQNKIKVYATSIAPNSIDYRQALKGGPLAYVFGSEAKGISEFWKESAQAITIPMKGTLDSLNLSVAVGIVLFNQ
jgi:TrmH family RNA methyltransferase